MPDEEDMSPFSKQKKISLSASIYEEIRNAILSGELEPGERIVETNVAEKMGVSRAPLREALRHLQKEGLVSVKAHRETRVVSFTLDDIKELHLLRATLETLAFQLTAKRNDQDTLHHIEEIVLKMEEAANKNDATTLAICDYDMHKELCKASGLPRLYRVWRDQHALLHIWLNVVAKAHDGDMINTAAAHRILYEAVISNDEKRIATEVFNHIYTISPAYKDERRKWANEAAWFFDQFKTNSADDL